MKIGPIESESSHADRQTDTHDDAECRFGLVCETALKVIIIIIIIIIITNLKLNLYINLSLM